MSLNILSIDVLQNIFPFVKSLQVVRIWLCGDKIMQLKMSEGGAVRKLRIENRAKELKKWQLIVPRFSHLQTFYFTIRSFDPKTSVELLTTLPATISDLRVPMSSVFQSVLHSHPDLPLFSSLRRLELYSEGTEARIAKNVTWPSGLLELLIPQRSIGVSLSKLPPNLTKLAVDIDNLVYGPGETFPSSLTWISIFFSAAATKIPLHSLLPSGLLHCNLCFTNNAQLTLNTLPPNLISLSTAFCHISAFCATPFYFPVSLTKLEVFAMRRGHFDLKWLPPSLTEASELVFPTEISAQNICLLPASLTFLPTTSQVSISCLNKLPSCITSVAVGCSTHEIHDAQMIETAANALFHLPLLEITLSHIAAWPLLDFPLPSSLLSLHIACPMNASLDVQQVKKLPVGLHTLSAPNFPFDSEECLQNLPPELTCLDAINCEFDSFAFPPTLYENPTFLPKSLVIFKLGCLVTKDPEWISLLPDSIIELQLHFAQLHNTWNASEEGKKVDVLAKTIPSSVQLPNIRLPRHLKLIHLYFNLRPYFGLVPYLKALPPTTERLRFDFVSKYSADGLLTNDDLITWLPPKLRFLYLPPSDAVDMRCSDLLPKKLDTFVIHGKTPYWFMETRRRELQQYKV
jgi:hypothetical protein